MTTLQAIGFTIAGGAAVSVLSFAAFGIAVRKRSINVAPRATARHPNVIFNPKAGRWRSELMGRIDGKAREREMELRRSTSSRIVHRGKRDATAPGGKEAERGGDGGCETSTDSESNGSSRDRLRSHRRADDDTAEEEETFADEDLEAQTMSRGNGGTGDAAREDPLSVQERGDPTLGWIPWTLSLSYDEMMKGVPGTGTRNKGLGGQMLGVNLDAVVLFRFHGKFIHPGVPLNNEPHRFETFPVIWRRGSKF